MDLLGPNLEDLFDSWLLSYPWILFWCSPLPSQSSSNLRFLSQFVRGCIGRTARCRRAPMEMRKGERVQWSSDRMKWILSFGCWSGGFADLEDFVRFLIHRSSCPSEFVSDPPQRKYIALSAAFDLQCLGGILLSFCNNNLCRPSSWITGMPCDFSRLE
jgi:hypothetical protein